MKVRATKLGYYDMVRRYPGDEFELKDVNGLDNFEGKPRFISAEKQFSERWMEKVVAKQAASDDEVMKPKGRTRAQVARVESSTGDQDVI